MQLYGCYAALIAMTLCLTRLVVLTTFDTSRKATDQARRGISIAYLVFFGLISWSTGFERDCCYVGLLIGVTGALSFFFGYRIARKQVRGLLFEAKELGDFGVDHFNELDSNKDGVVCAADLVSPETKRRLTSLDLTILGRLLKALDDIGHPASGSEPGAARSQFIRVPNVASLDDFASYYDRRVKQLGGWLK